MNNKSRVFLTDEQNGEENLQENSKKRSCFEDICRRFLKLFFSAGGGRQMSVAPPVFVHLRADLEELLLVLHLGDARLQLPLVNARRQDLDDAPGTNGTIAVRQIV